MNRIRELLARAILKAQIRTHNEQPQDFYPNRRINAPIEEIRITCNHGFEMSTVARMAKLRNNRSWNN